MAALNLKHRIFVEKWADIKDRVYRETDAVVVECHFMVDVYHKHETDPCDIGYYIGNIAIKNGSLRSISVIPECDAMLADIIKIIQEEIAEKDTRTYAQKSISQWRLINAGILVNKFLSDRELTVAALYQEGIS